MSDQKKWMIRSNQEILGPFTKEEVQEKIDQLEFQGHEEIVDSSSDSKILLEVTDFIFPDQKTYLNQQTKTFQTKAKTKKHKKKKQTKKEITKQTKKEITKAQKAALNPLDQKKEEKKILEKTFLPRQRKIKRKFFKKRLKKNIFLFSLLGLGLLSVLMIQNKGFDFFMKKDQSLKSSNHLKDFNSYFHFLKKSLYLDDPVIQKDFDLLESFPNKKNELIWYLKAIFWLKNKDTDLSLHFFKKAVKEKYSIESVIYISFIYFDQNQYKTSLDWLNRYRKKAFYEKNDFFKDSYFFLVILNYLYLYKERQKVSFLDQASKLFHLRKSYFHHPYHPIFEFIHLLLKKIKKEKNLKDEAILSLSPFQHNRVKHDFNFYFFKNPWIYLKDFCHHFNEEPALKKSFLFCSFNSGNQKESLKDIDSFLDKNDFFPFLKAYFLYQENNFVSFIHLLSEKVPLEEGKPSFVSILKLNHCYRRYKKSKNLSDENCVLKESLRLNLIYGEDLLKSEKRLQKLKKNSFKEEVFSVEASLFLLEIYLKKEQKKNFMDLYKKYKSQLQFYKAYDLITQKAKSKSWIK